MIHTYYSDRGGEDLVFETESRLLQANGVEVETLAFTNNKNTLIKFLFYPFNLVSFSKTIFKLRRFRPDIVHIHNWHFAASLAIFLACYIYRVPIVHTLHNYRLICPSGSLYNKNKIYLKSLYGSWLTPVKDKVYRASAFQTFWVKVNTEIFYKLGIARFVKCYIVLTPSAKEIFMKSRFNKLENRFVIKSNFLEDIQQKVVKRQPYFLYVGRLILDKGMIVLLEAFKGTPYELRIIGGGPLQQLVEETAAKSANIKYLGFQKKEIIQQCMMECAALVFPSVSYEGIPMTILEAYACGCPVIGSRFTAMETMITDGVNGLHFEVEKPEDLKKKVEYFAHLTEQEKDVFYKNARQQFESKYAAANNLKELQLIYLRVLAQKKMSKAVKPEVK